jgi:hypothetical protein
MKPTKEMLRGMLVSSRLWPKMSLMRRTAGLSTLDVAIFDYVRNTFLKDLTNSFLEACDFKTSVSRHELGYLEGVIGRVQWRLRFDIVHRGNGYDIETVLHVGHSFQDAQFKKWETGQHEALDHLFEEVNKTLNEYSR